MICSMTAYNRPQYLAPVMESFEIAARVLAMETGEPTFLCSRIEPSEHLTGVRLLLSRGRGYYPAINDDRLGLQANTLAVLKDAWHLAQFMKEDFVLHLEDDLVIAPDTLRLAAWMRDTYRDDPEIVNVGMTTVLRPAQPDSWLRVFRTSWFDCHVWGTWRDVWEKDMLPQWPHDWPDHWAAFVNERVMQGRLQILPCLARSKSIGEFGQHSNEYYHAKHNPELYGGDVDIPVGDYYEAGDWPAGAEPWYAT